MSFLEIARATLLLALLAFGLVLAAGMLKLLKPDAAMLLGWLTGVVIGLSALACVMAQVASSLRRKP